MTGFQGKVATDIRDSQPDWAPFLAPKAREGAPNILMLVWDDLGFSTMDIFGGPIETPNMRRIAEMGVSYSNFHTTALCSPTRSSLLNGRNATSNGMATIAEFSSGFPGISTRIPFENGFISEVLAEQGYNTYCVGKWHLTPGEEVNMAAYKGRWPLGRGFERFYGYLGGESNSWYPDLIYDNHPIDAPATPEEGYHLSKDLSDKAIEFISDAHQVDPDKPFFLYLAPQAGHAPHHAPQEWIDKYKGRFDDGYEALREEILKRQIEMGILPEGTELSPINPHGEPQRTGPDGQPWPLLDTVRPWDSLSDDERQLFSRMAEVFAGYIAYADYEMGRVLDYLEESGQLENTLIVSVSDNGASGEGGPNGSFNEWRFFNGVPDSTDETFPHIDELGGPESYNHYCTGWAWAFDTPFPYWKRWAGYEGGVADMCLVAWPKQIEPQDQPRSQYIHAVDVVPTIYELAGIEPPETINGYKQNPIEGESFAASAGTEGVVFAHGGVSGGHSLFVKDGKLRYAFNWVGTYMQNVTAESELEPGKHLVVAEFTATGKNDDPKMPGAKGTLDLYVDDEKVGSGEIVTQPGYFCVVGDGLCVGRDSASPVTPEYKAPFHFTGEIEKVIIDVSGDRYPSHEGDVRAWFSID